MKKILRVLTPIEVTDGYLRDSEDVTVAVENVILKGAAQDIYGNPIEGGNA